MHGTAMKRDVSGDIHLFCHFAGNSGASAQVSKLKTVCKFAIDLMREIFNISRDPACDIRLPRM